MKVGTDGVLLGAWANANHPRRILDIGTGSGLIALMLAQRYEEETPKIHAVEIDEQSATQAQANFDASPWSHYFRLVNQPIQEFAKLSPSHSFDLITCNPPFFENDFPSPNRKRRVAKHANQLSRQSLFDVVARLLNSRGRLCIVIPSEQFTTSKQTAMHSGLVLSKIVNVRPTQSAAIKRVLLQFRLSKTLEEVSNKEITREIVIETSRHQYSTEFAKLVEKFYLRYLTNKSSSPAPPR